MNNGIHPLNKCGLDFESDSPRLPQPHHYVRITVYIGRYITKWPLNREVLDADFFQNFLNFSVAQPISVMTLIKMTF